MKMLFFWVGMSLPFLAWSQLGKLDSSCYELPKAVLKYHSFLGMDKQIVEIDFLSAWKTKIQCLEATRPRAMQWSDVIPPPNKASILVQMDKSDSIHKVWNMDIVDMNLIRKYIPKKEPSEMDISTITACICSPHQDAPPTYLKIFDINDTCTCNYWSPMELFWYRAGGSSCPQGLIDIAGDTIFAPIYEFIQPHDTLFIYQENKRLGLMTQSKQVLIPTLYDELKFVGEGLWQTLSRKKQKIIILNQKGRKLRSFSIPNKRIYMIEPKVKQWIKQHKEKNAAKNRNAN